ncbi:MAG TPA: TrkA family potassium uptake protein [bacterium]|nr:TrkA family potassium uptake protein [bacterium]
MYVIVVGGGKVGYYLTKALVSAGLEVTVIEKQRRRYELLQEEFGDAAFLGDGCEVRTLEQAGAPRADLLAAVTGDDEDNLVSCQMAKRKFKVKRVIARINNPKNEVTFQMLGIDETVSSTKLIYSLIEQEVEVADVIPLTALRRGNLELVEVALPKTSPIVNRRVRDIALPQDCTLALLVRGENAQVIDGDTALRAGDLIVAITPSGHVQELRDAMLGKAITTPP